MAIKAYTCEVFLVQKVKPGQEAPKPKRLDSFRIVARTKALAMEEARKKLVSSGRRIRALNHCPHDRLVAYVEG